MEGQETRGGMGAAKDIGDLARQYGLIALVLIVVFFPRAIGDWFKESGFKKFSGLGVELTREEAETIVQTQQALAQAVSAKEQLQSQLQATSQTLQTLKAQQDDPDVQARIVRQLDASKAALHTADQQTRRLEKASNDLKPLIRKADAVLHDPGNVATEPSIRRPASG